VRTQLPYALLAGGTALLVGTIPTSLGLPWWVGMLGAAAVTALSLRLLGTPVADYQPDNPADTAPHAL
jgi:Na+/H+ antiporter NhaC